MNILYKKLFLLITMLTLSVLSQAMSKHDYGQIDITVKDSQPCFYLANYNREVPVEEDKNKLVYVTVSKGSEMFFIIHNTYIDIPNSPQTCLPVSAMKALTDENVLLPDTHYYVTMILGIEDKVINGTNYSSEFCLIKDNNAYKIVEGDRGRVTPNSDLITNYCTDIPFEEQKSWLERFKAWFRALF